MAQLAQAGVAQAAVAQAGVDILVSSQLANCVDEWIPLGGWVCISILKLLGRSLCLIHAYGPNSSALFPEFVEETSETQRRVKTNESTILLGDFNAHVGKDAGVYRSM